MTKSGVVRKGVVTQMLLLLKRGVVKTDTAVGDGRWNDTDVREDRRGKSDVSEEVCGDEMCVQDRC